MNKNRSTPGGVVTTCSTGGTPQKPDRRTRLAGLAAAVVIYAVVYYVSWVLGGINAHTMSQRVFLFVWSNALSLAGGAAANAWVRSGRR